MTTDIREAAARAAHRFGLETCTGNRTADGAAEIGYEAGYLAGHEAAKAESAKPKRVRRAACPFDADDMDEERHGKL